MKLYNSIKTLKDLFDNEYLAEAKNRRALSSYIDWLIANPKISKYEVAFRWMLWNNLTKKQRDDVISKSVLESDKVGGYYQSVNDNHIDTLLRKVLPIITIIRIRTY